MVELFIEDNPIYLKNDTKFQFNYTIGDILNIASLQVSYSNVFDAPLTPENTRTMQGLGLVGNNSQLPYQKLSVNVKYDGFDIVRSGWLDIQETSNNYRMGVREGILDFWKEIENKTIGNDLDISDLEHNKNVDTFITSIINNSFPYTYVTANFGGKMQLPNNVINIDYLVPAVRLSYFWDKIFETFGYTYSGSIFSNPDFTDAYITYPKAPDAGEINETFLSSADRGFINDANPVQTSAGYEFPNSYNWANSGAGFGAWNFTAPETKTYRFRVKPIGYVRYSAGSSVLSNPYELQIYSGSNLIKSFNSVIVSDDPDLEDYYTDIEMAQGSTITFKIVFPNIPYRIPLNLFLRNLEVEVFETSLGTIDFVDAFSDFALKDYIKEIIWRYGLTPVYNSDTKHITFYTIDERVNFNNYENWTEKYARRKRETYIYQQYAQTNVFTHKYNDEGDTFNNGQLRIANANLQSSKVIAQSKIYSAERTLRTYRIGSSEFESLLYPVWDSNIVETEDGIEVEYKGLNGRYYIMKLQQVNSQGSFQSEALETIVHTTPFYFVPNANNTHYNDLIAKYYPTYEKILNNFKMHEIELALGLPDILQLDFMKLYYFEQEASFYMLNKLTWEEGKTCKGEFIKINT